MSDQSPDFYEKANEIVQDYLDMDHEFDEKTLGRLMKELISEGLREAYKLGQEVRNV